MKNVFTLALILVGTIIMVSSCSQLSSSSLMKSQYSGASENSSPMNDRINSTPVKGNSSVRAGTEDVKDSKVENNGIMNNDNSFGNGINDNTNEIISESRDNNNISQPVNYSGNSGHSSHGVPFWLIVVCAIIIPPLGVALMYGITDKFWICLALTLCFWLPGMIYALILVIN